MRAERLIQRKVRGVFFLVTRHHCTPVLFGPCHEKGRLFYMHITLHILIRVFILTEYAENAKFIDEHGPDKNGS